MKFKSTLIYCVELSIDHSRGLWTANIRFHSTQRDQQSASSLSSATMILAAWPLDIIK